MVPCINFLGNNTRDRGFHYGLDSWISLMNEYGYKRSMSKKGCSPDNSMCEGFFGTIKNDFFIQEIGETRHLMNL